MFEFVLLNQLVFKRSNFQTFHAFHTFKCSNFQRLKHFKLSNVQSLKMWFKFQNVHFSMCESLKSLKVWSLTSLQAWKFENRFNLWKFESLNAWKFESLKVWNFESCRIGPRIHLKRLEMSMGTDFPASKLSNLITFKLSNFQRLNRFSNFPL